MRARTLERSAFSTSMGMAGGSGWERRWVYLGFEAAGAAGTIVIFRIRVGRTGRSARSGVSAFAPSTSPASIDSTTSIPDTTFAKAEYFPRVSGAAEVQMKNWDVEDMRDFTFS